MTFEDHSEKPKGSSFWRKVTHCVAILAILAGTFPGGSIPAQAMFGTKTLTIQHMHTGESATITFARGGRYDQQALDQLNWLLRDWRTDEPIKMDPRLFDLLSEVYDQSGSRQPIRVVSAYRSPKTNSMLRRRSKMVAEHSQHMLGKAMDFYLTDVSSERIRSIAMRMQDGGVGYYPNANTPFIHLDVGSVRAWPRMTRTQLSNLFPDGKTVHVPADGRPLPGYDAARAMVLARGGKVAGESYAYADAGESGGKRKSFWATLFGGSDEEEDTEVQVPSRAVAARSAPQRVASNDDGNSDRPMAFFSREQQRNEAPEPQPMPTRFRIASRTPEPLPVASAVPATPVSAPILASVPLPPSRQLALAAQDSPRMVWQANASEQRSNPKNNPFEPAATGAQIAFSANNNRKGGDEGISQNVMTYAPLPPSRPGSGAATRRGEDLANAPITTASIAPAPKPPSRLSGQPAKTAVTAAIAAKPAKETVKTTTKAAVSQPAPTKTAAVAKDNKVQGDPKAKATAAGNAPAASKQAHAQPKPISPGSGGFAKSVYADLSTSQFSGSTLKTPAKK